MDNLADVYDLHRFESTREPLEFINPQLVETESLFPVAVFVKGGVCSLHSTQRESKVTYEWPGSTLPPGRCNPNINLDQILSSGE